jgi:hypothetical protein
MLFETGQQGSLLGNTDYDGQLPTIHFQAPGCGLWFASLAGMKKQLLLLTGILWSAASLKAQSDEAVVKKDAVSIHTVERGSMSIFSSARGALTSLQPRRAVLTFDNNGGRCDSGRSARLVIADNPKPFAGKVVGNTDAGNCEVEFADALPEGAVIGSSVGALIVTNELKDVVFFGRPAVSRPNTTATIFVLEGASRARRATVRYGAMSGPLIQVLDGLAPGDKVIVTDMSKWADFPVVRLE